jgi:hypothetical protein
MCRYGFSGNYLFNSFTYPVFKQLGLVTSVKRTEAHIRLYRFSIKGNVIQTAFHSYQRMKYFIHESLWLITQRGLLETRAIRATT